MKQPIVLIAAAVLLAACSSSAGTAGTSSSAPAPSSPAASTSPTGTAPTAEQTAWAGNVCTSVGELKTSVEGLASAAAAGGGNVKTALAAQVAVIKTSADNLVTTVTELPAGSESDPELAALKTSAEELKASVTGLETSVQAVDAATNAVGTVTALAGVAAAATVSITALTDIATALNTAAQDGKGTLSQAIAANDSCTALNV